MFKKLQTCTFSFEIPHGWFLISAITVTHTHNILPSVFFSVKNKFRDKTLLMSSGKIVQPNVVS
jgi:hypothetical protein